MSYKHIQTMAQFYKVFLLTPFDRILHLLHHTQQLQPSISARRFLHEVIIHASTRGDSATTIPFAFAPLPPMSSGQSQSSDSISSSFDTVNHFSPSVAIIMVALLSAFFFMGFFSLYVRRCADSSSLDARGSLRRADESDEQQEQGVDPDFLHGLPLIAFSSAKKKGSNIECVVCLTDFEEHEPLRQLPVCKHVFHQDCIDMWLFSHSTCPLCRHGIIQSSESFSLRWGGSGNLRQVGGGGGSGQQLVLLGGGGGSEHQLNAMDEMGTVAHTEMESNDTNIGIHRGLDATTQCDHGNPPVETNINNFLQRPFAEMRVNHGNQSMRTISSTAAGEGSCHASSRAMHNMDSRRQQVAHLTRPYSTGHSLQMEPGPANEANFLLTSPGESSFSENKCAPVE